MDPLTTINTVFSLPGADRVSLGHPSVLALPGGRILAAVDLLGPGVRDLTGTKGRYADTQHWMQGRVFASADEGQTWTCKLEYGFGQACLFRDGNQVYLLGHHGPLMIIKSPDGGETWSKPEELRPKGGGAETYSHSPCSVLHAHGQVYAVVMRAPDATGRRRVMPGTLMPVLLRAMEGSNLLNARSWTWSEPAPDCETLAPWESVDGFGLPFYETPSATAGASRHPWSPRPGWMHPHAVCISDPQHYWHAASGRPIHVLAAAESQRGNLAGQLRYTEDGAGVMRPAVPAVPSGKPQFWLPLPGGNRKFDIRYDADSKCYWLLSNQVRDSMARVSTDRHAPPELPADRSPLLQLSFSQNLVDWVTAGWVAGSAADPLAAPACDVRGRDLCVVACGRDAQDPTNRHAKRLVFGLVRNFRGLSYGTP